MVDYGGTYSATNFIAIGTTVSGAGDATKPDGTRVILWVPNKEFKGSYDALQRIKNMALGMSYSNKNGKKKDGNIISTAYIIKHGAYATNTEAFNAAVNQLRAFQKGGASPAYLVAANGIDNKTICLSTTNAGVAVYYLKGYVKSFDWEIDGNIYLIKNLQWVECAL